MLLHTRNQASCTAAGDPRSSVRNHGRGLQRVARPCCRGERRVETAFQKEGSSPASAFIGLAAAATLVFPGNASAAVEQIGEFEASGFLFKDMIEVSAYDDPVVEGVTLYFSDFKRSLTDKLAKDFFSEPSQASLSCDVVGPVVIKDMSKLGGKSGAEVFSESRGFNPFKNKTLRLRRIYDAKRNSLLYIAYSTRLTGASDEGNVSSGRYKTSLCAIKIPDPEPAPPVSAPPVSASQVIPGDGTN
ncbi:CreA protein-domain-containing protein [Dunaliella salina]|uniref:CreA protein-domain-containing protein n=1 Tax=Dunaliella salina TaxID=3046 RepID=A0ABQ7GFQ4_DUNSA|nr:CreA protein-domain-containing protein [Dunaliella salina]|eukprot:KAF5833423.1 CreA protein-domain-containing protein [Dunaliella salina]